MGGIHGRVSAARGGRWHAALALLVAALALAVTEAALAQDFRIVDPAGDAVGLAPHVWPPFTHWDLREMPGCEVPWLLGANAVPDLDGNGIPDLAADRAIASATFQAAFDRWDAVAPSEINFSHTFVGGALPPGGFAADGFNTLSFSAAALGVGTLARTVVVRDAGTGRITEADIVFNSSVAPVPGIGIVRWVIRAHGVACCWDQDLPPVGNWPTPADGDTDWDGDGVQEIEVDLGTVATHEIGHFLGLHHAVPLGTAQNDPAHAIMEEFWTPGIGPTGSGFTNLTLKVPDIDGENFLYCPDLGDAPDPWMGVPGLYPSLVHIRRAGRTLNGVVLDGVGPGAEHIFGIKPRQPARNWTYEWLGCPRRGDNVDGECEANVVDRDLFDDGLTFFPNPPVWGRPLCVTVWVRYASDNVGNAHDYATYPLWVNAWIDLDQDCVWNLGGEWFLNVGLSPGSPGGPNATGRIGVLTYVNLPPLVPRPLDPVWLRCRLDYGEDVGLAANIDGTLAFTAGAAQLGEVEDYPFWCFTQYEQEWVENTTGEPVGGTAMVFVGPPGVIEQTFGAVVDANDCVQSLLPPPLTFYNGVSDETVTEFHDPALVPPGGKRHSGKCKPPNEKLTLARTYWLPLGGGGGSEEAESAKQEIPPELWIPSVNCGVCLLGPLYAPTGVRVTVGALDAGTGGWIGGTPDPDNMMVWQDSLWVNVSYRVAPWVLPLPSLSPCDPIYAQLAQHPVGSGHVTPETGFEFDLDIAADIQPGQVLIVEVESSWNTNGTTNHQIVEFPDVVSPSGIDETPKLSHLALENIPNPFNASTIVRYTLPEPATVSIRIYDVQGRLVRTLVDGESKPAGVLATEWNGRDDSGEPVASGVYFVRMNAGAQSLTRKAVFLK